MSVVINGVKAELATAIRFVANPKRTGKKAWTRYEEYSECNTLAEYFDIADTKYAKADLRYDHEHGFLIFDEATDDLAEALDVLHGE